MDGSLALGIFQQLSSTLLPELFMMTANKYKRQAVVQSVQYHHRSLSPLFGYLRYTFSSFQNPSVDTCHFFEFPANPIIPQQDASPGSLFTFYIHRNHIPDHRLPRQSSRHPGSTFTANRHLYPQLPSRHMGGKHCSQSQWTDPSYPAQHAASVPGGS